MNWEFEKISYLYLLVLIPFLVWRMLYLYGWKRSKITRFADSSLQERIFGNINLQGFIRDNIWIIIAFILIVLSLANLLGGVEKKEVKREGIDIVFVIDVSTSMNAEDVLPSRIEKARKIIGDIIAKLGGDRVGMVVFAGHAYSVMPLSNDYGAAEIYLSGVDTKLITAQGTNIANAVQEASNMLSHISNTSKAIVLVSDGESHKGEVDKALAMADKNEITIFSVGMGTPQGAPIPVTHQNGYSEYKKDENGDIVLTRLEDSSLKQLAIGTKGAYFYGGNPTGEVTRQLFNSLSTLNKKEQSINYTNDSKQYFQFSIGVALMILIIVSLTNYRRDFNV
ncbi:MAG: VWA domain-containing protein [Flavobacteriaceae bacterium]|jgi:Ca-activated chloride channel family protein|nr:VWA domain-containing protein [Flavobacteriaceae bacterium]